MAHPQTTTCRSSKEKENFMYLEETPQERHDRLRAEEKAEAAQRAAAIAANVGVIPESSPFVVDAEGNLWRKPFVSPPSPEPVRLPEPTAMTSVKVRPANNTTVEVEMPKPPVKQTQPVTQRVAMQPRFADPYAGEAERNAAAMQNALIRIGDRTVCTICRTDVEPSHSH